MEKLYSLKMRASKNVNGASVHISGAEKIVYASDVKSFSDSLIMRGLNHERGQADFLNLKITELKDEDILYLDALKVETVEVKDWKEGHEEIKKFLLEIGIENPEKIMGFISQTYAMRGAMLLDVENLVRLENDFLRGIRATNMDQERKAGEQLPCRKNHYEEAIVLATKVANCPGILGEICISDDPDYVTGYVSSIKTGYRRITKMKEMGSPNGGRIFLFRGNRLEAEKAIDFLQNQPVIVRKLKKLPAESQKSRWSYIEGTLSSLKEENLFRTTKAFSSPQGPHVKIGGREYVLMASNDYLDVANHSSVKKAVKNAIEKYGFGSGGSRLTTGNTELHDLLESKIAQFKGCESSLLFNTGYVANLASISALCNKDFTIFSDELNHASIIDGCRLSKAKIVTYRHNDMEDLRNKIAGNPFSLGLAVSDAVFSMDGDILNYPEFLDVCQKNNLFSMVDEAHSTGVIGKTGRGIKEYWNESRNPDLLMGTLSKALGGEGGFVAGRRQMIEFLRNKARGYVFSTSLSPAVIAGNLEGLRILENETFRVKALQHNVEFFCGQLTKNGLKVKSETAIIPIVVGEEKKALELSEFLFDKGFYISAIRYPTVAKGNARLRIALMSSHTEKELSLCACLIASYLKSQAQGLFP